MTRLFSLLLTLLILASCAKNTKTENQNSEPFKNTSLSFEERSKDLISKMTLEEKVGQMHYESPAIERLGIPEYNWWNECLHGVARAGKATVFPQAIGMAAMFDKEQMRKVATTISDEARAKHHQFAKNGKRGIYQGLTFWTPNINIFRDPRWGRGMETYGEDPYLSGELAVEFIQGLQGDDPKYLKLVATAKHFAVHSGPEADRHHFNVDPSPQDFLNTYSPHFEKVVKEAKVHSVMCAYNSFEGEPCCGNKKLSSLLRDDWGFDGYIVSDCWAVRDFYDKSVKTHQVVETVEEASAMAVKAGTDLNCGNSYPHLVKAVEQGLITEEELDVSLERLFVARMKLGLFAPKGEVSFENISYDVVDSESHQNLALETAHKSIVLLKNENKILPIDKSTIKKVAVIGSNAEDLEVLLGNYNGYPTKPVTPLEGIKQKLPNAEIIYAVGSKLAEGLPVFEAIPPSVLFTDETMKSSGLNASYFDNIDFSGEPKHSQVDKKVDNIWWTKAPFEDMNPDEYSVRWEGILSVPKTGKYALGVEGFSSVKLFLKDSLVVEREDVHHPKKIYEYVTLKKGEKYPIKFEAVQNHTDYSIMRLLWESPKDNLEKEALSAAKEADLVLFFGGISPLLEGEEMKVKVDGFSGGDRVHTKLPESQTNLLKKLKTTGKPIVLTLLNGSALSINWENAHLPAILEAWYPGQAGGTAIADIIFGDYNPSGRLPVTFYKDISDIPPFSEYDMKGKTYRYFKGEPLFEFGYGLSFTDFQYKNLQVKDSININEKVEVSVEVSNTGEFDGEEVVQIYITNPNPLPSNPLITLAEFKRIQLRKGETQTLTFNIDKDQLYSVNSEGKKVIVPGDLIFSAGGAQPSVQRENAKASVSKIVQLTQNK